jgi:hypothetical protein
MTSYEWDVETVAIVETTDYAIGDIAEHYHCESYREALAYAEKTEPPAGFGFAIVLVRDDDALRAWAYVEKGQLSEVFSDANGVKYRKTPKRFIDEVNAARVDAGKDPAVTVREESPETAARARTVTPAWCSVFPIFSAVLRDGTRAGREELRAELARLCAGMDALNTIRDSLTDEQEKAVSEVIARGLKRCGF